MVNTPYYMSDCSIEGFEKTDSGYEFSADGLPDGELTFLLSTSENPVPPKSFVPKTTSRVYAVVIIAVAAVAALAIAGVTLFIIFKRKKSGE